MRLEKLLGYMDYLTESNYLKVYYRGLYGEITCVTCKFRRICMDEKALICESKHNFGYIFNLKNVQKITMHR